MCYNKTLLILNRGCQADWQFSVFRARGSFSGPMLLSIRNRTIHELFQGWPSIPFAGSFFSESDFKCLLRVLLVTAFCSLGPLRGRVWCFQTAGIAYKEHFARVERELGTQGRLCRGWVVTQLQGKSLVHGDRFWKAHGTPQSPSSGKPHCHNSWKAFHENRGHFPFSGVLG